MESVNITTEDGKELRELFKEIPYSVFGIFFPSQERKKLDIPTGGYDEVMPMPPSPKTGTGLQIMTPNQLITRLPILLAQKQASNNSQKLNNEIRHIIYSLYRSKTIT